MRIVQNPENKSFRESISKGSLVVIGQPNNRLHTDRCAPLAEDESAQPTWRSLRMSLQVERRLRWVKRGGWAVPCKG